MARKIFSVYQINRYVKNLLERDEVLTGVFIQGEISNLKAHTSGHWYFTLKDADAAMSCVMFRAAASSVAFLPAVGMKVILSGRVSLYEKTGAYQFYADTMEPAGKGALALAFEQRKAKLEQEGLFDVRYKKPIPFLPRCVAIVTSETGAAVRDVIQIARRRNPGVELVVAPTAVQGLEAAKDIAAALRMVNSWDKADVIILTRGGGSQEDLWPFNEEIVARAVFASKIPIISAIGHETDFSLADFTADLRAPTPSAAAELAIPDTGALLADVQAAMARQHRVTRRLLLELRNRLRRQSVMHSHALHTLENKKNKALGKTDALEKLSPLAVLGRGYVLTLDDAGRVIPSVRLLRSRQTVSLRFWDGYCNAMIIGDQYVGEEFQKINEEEADF